MTDSNNDKPTVAELIARLQSTTTATNKALAETNDTVRRIEAALIEDHDSIVMLQRKIMELEQRGGNISFANLILAGFTAAEAKAILDIKSDQDLTDEVVVHHLLETVRGIRKDVDDLNELALVQVEETMKLRENVGGLDSRVTRLEQAPAPIAATTSAQRKITRNEKWAIALLSIIVMLLWGMYDFRNTATANNQNFSSTSAADLWFVAPMAGIAAAFIMLSFFYLVDFSSLKEKKLPKAKKVKVQQAKSTTPSPAPAATAVMPSSPKPARAPKTAKQEDDDARLLLNMSDQELAALGSNTPAVFDQDEQIVIKPAQQPMQVSLN